MNLSALGGIFATILGLIYTIQALMLPEAPIGNPLAPKIFPLGIGILLIFFGLILTFSEIKKVGLKVKDIKKNKNENIRLIIYTSLTCILYGLIFNRLGYVISTIIFLEIILLLFNGKEKLKTNTVVSICFSVIIYFLFSRFLGVTLPAMPFL